MSILTVTTTADNGSGSLRSAIAAATSGDTIQFSGNLAKKTITLKSGQLVLNKDLTIDGGGAPGLTISGNRASRVFYLDRRKKATLKNLTIANGKTKGAGGGIDTRHESIITLENVRVHGNTSELGGGMRVGHLAKATIINSSFRDNDGTLTEKHKGFSAGAISHNESRGQLIIKGTTFENNKGFNGGAIFSISGVTFVVENSTFKGNTAKNMEGGGAIFVDGVSSKGYSSGLANDGKILISGSRFEGNKAEGEGGALLLWGYTKKQGYKQDQAIIKDTVFIDNVVTRNENAKGKGGAIWAKIGLDIRNVTFANNIATQQGGALWLESSLPANIVNSTFSANQALKDAGGALFLNSRSTPINITNSTIAYNKAGRANGALWFDGRHNVTLKNSIVAFNTAGDRRQDQAGYQPKDGGGNLEFATSAKALRLFDSALVADPMLNALSKSGKGLLVHSLRPGSPAINAGVNQGAPKTDQRGTQRDSKTDIGAFELTQSGQGTVLKPVVTDILAPSPLTQQGQTQQNQTASPSPTFTQKPVVHLAFNEGQGKRAKDSSANGRNNYGELKGGAAWIEGDRGAIAFDGKNDVVRLKSSKDINFGKQSQRTVSLRFRANEIDTGNQHQVLYEEGGSGRGLNIYIDKSGDKDRLYVGGWNTPGKESGWSGSWLSTDISNISDDKWYRVDLVLEGGSQVAPDALRGYFDGQQFGSDAGSQLWSHGGGIGIGNVNGDTRFHDGISAKGSTGFSGAIDEVTIFNHALSSSEIGASI